MKSLFIFLFFWTSIIMSQEVEKNVNAIRNTYNHIESNLNNYTVKTVNVDNLSTEGGEAIGYLKSNEIEKIHVALFGETGKSFYDFYYSRSKLIFVLETRHQYNRPLYWDKEASEEYGDTEVFDKAKTQILENRYYFKNDKIILWLADDQKLTPTASTNSESKAKDLAELSNELKENISKY